MASSKKLESTKKMIRAVLLSCKEGVQAHKLQSDFKSLTGGGIPFQKLGFNSVNELIQSMPDVVRVSERYGDIIYHAVADESTQHIQKMVSSQRSAKKKKIKRGYKYSRPNLSSSYGSRYTPRGSTKSHGQRKVLLPTPCNQKKGLLPTPVVRHASSNSSKRTAGSNVYHLPTTGVRVMHNQRQIINTYSTQQTKNKAIMQPSARIPRKMTSGNVNAHTPPPCLKTVQPSVSKTNSWISEKLKVNNDASKEMKLNDVIKIRIKTLLGSNPGGVFSNTLSKLYFDAYGCQLAESIVYGLEGGAIAGIATIEKLTCGAREKTILYPIKQISPVKLADKAIPSSGLVRKVEEVDGRISVNLIQEKNTQKFNQDKLNNNKAQSTTSQTLTKRNNPVDATWKSEKLVLTPEMKEMVMQVKNSVRDRIKAIISEHPCGISSTEFESAYFSKFSNKFPDSILKNLECGLVEGVATVEKLTRGNREKIIFHPLISEPKSLKTEKKNERGFVSNKTTDEKENDSMDIIKQRIKRILSACPRGISASRLSTAYFETFKDGLDRSVIVKMEMGLLRDVTNIEIVDNGSKVLFFPHQNEIRQQGPKYPALSSKILNKIPEARVLRMETEYDARIRHIVDCGQFYVQLSEFADDLEKIQQVSKHAKFGTIPTLSLGMETISWIESGGRRGRIVDVCGSKALIYHMDYGDKQQMHRQHLAPMLDELKSIPEIAVLCSLHKQDDNADWSQRASSKFNHLFLGKKIKAEVNSVRRQSIDGALKIIYNVTCYLGSLNINERLMKEEEQIEEYHSYEVLDPTNTTLSEKEDDGDTSYETIDSESSISESEIELSIHSSHIDPINSTNICHESMDISNSSVHFDETDSGVFHMQNVSTPPVKSLSNTSASSFSVNNQHLSGKLFSKSFDSYSSRVELARSRHRSSPEQQIVPGITHSLNKLSLSALNNCPSTQDETFNFLSQTSTVRHDLSTPVSIKPCTKHVSGSKNIYSLSYATAKMTQWRYRAGVENDQQDELKNNTVDSSIHYMTSPLKPSIARREFGKLVRVIVTKIQSPGTFYMVPYELLPMLHNLTSQMNEHYIPLSTSTVNPVAISEGSLYAAPCDVDGVVRWHRVKICKIVQSLASVLLIDLGTRDCVSIDKVHALLPQFVRPAPFAICGQLAGIKPINLSTDLIQDAAKLFEEWVTGKELIAHIVKKSVFNESLVYDVCLYDRKENGDGEWLNDLMVDTWKIAEYIADVAA